MSIATLPSAPIRVRSRLNESFCTNQERLIVTHTNPDLYARLANAFQNAWVLEHDQNEWSFAASEWTDHLEKEVAEKGIKELVIVGDSMSLETAAGHQVSRSITERAQIAAANRQRAWQHFVDQVQHLASHPGIAQRLQRKALRIRALFYRVEAGSFFLYDHQNGQAVPLSANLL